MYNFCLAFAACCVVYLIGDAVSRLTGAWVPSVFVMAAVMAGGMVPPIGIALAMALFPDRFEEQEKERRAVTFCMGLSFITEGALPFVFTDVFRVIPSCVVGSFIAGALSEFFGCRLPAPHGGIFVLPVMEHPWLYIMALLMGSLATAIILGLLKKHADKE